MITSNYGLGPSVLQTTGRGAGLAGVGNSENADASSMLGQAAQLDTQLQEGNKARRQQQRQGTAAAAASGAATGFSVGGWWGAAAGAIIGAGTSLF